MFPSAFPLLLPTRQGKMWPAGYAGPATAGWRLLTGLCCCHTQNVPGSGDSQAGGLPLPQNERTSNSEKAEPASTQSPRLLSSPVPRMSFTQVKGLRWRASGLSALGTEAGLRFTIMVSGGQSVMTAGTIQMPLSSAACWATPGEPPLPEWYLVSGSSATFLELSLWLQGLSEFGLKAKDWFKKLKSPVAQCPGVPSVQAGHPRTKKTWTAKAGLGLWLTWHGSLCSLRSHSAPWPRVSVSRGSLKDSEVPILEEQKSRRVGKHGCHLSYLETRHQDGLYLSAKGSNFQKSS